MASFKKITNYDFSTAGCVNYAVNYLKVGTISKTMQCNNLIILFTFGVLLMGWQGLDE